MGKSDDSISRRKNKKNRKKQQDSSKVSNHIASLIAAKKRRQSGKRRICQGMCFSLPTPEDPFNDGHGKIDPVKKIKKPSHLRDNKLHVDKKLGESGTDSLDSNSENIDIQEQKLTKLEKLDSKPITSFKIFKSVEQKNIKQGKSAIPVLSNCGANNNQGGQEDFLGCPSKFLILCLNSIQNALRDEMALSSEEDRPLFVHKWGVEFWKLYTSGKDVLETSGADSTFHQIAWVASCAADTIARKEKEGQSINSPFLLFLVPSQEKAAKVRKICKPLKALGIHAVSLHPGASIDHQIHGLKSCEPEFLLSTPDRLLELVSLDGVNISGVSFLVIDGLETHSKDDFLDSVKLIRQSIPGSPQTVVFSNCSSDFSIQVLQSLLQESVSRISLRDLVCLR